MQRRIEQQPGELTASACLITLQPPDNPHLCKGDGEHAVARDVDQLPSPAVQLAQHHRLQYATHTMICIARH